MQNNGRFMLSDRTSNKKNSNRNVGGVQGLMREYSIHGEALKAMDERKKFLSDLSPEDRAAFFKMLKVAREQKRAEEDAPIIAAYDEKKEDLEHLYKMPNSDKKWALVKAAKAELDEMYTNNVCIRKHVYELKQARIQTKIDKDLGPFKMDLLNIAGRLMRSAELGKFLERANKHTKVHMGDGVYAWFVIDDVMYEAVEVKNGYRWNINLI